MTDEQGNHRSSAPPAALQLLDTGVAGLNEVLGGGLPVLSFNVIAGGPGAGKTTMAMQVLFANATPARPGLFITLLGETSLKMLRYQQLFSFFDPERVGADVHFLNLTEEALEGDLDGVLMRIILEVDRLHPGVVVVDSFRSLARAAGSGGPTAPLEHFIQRLAQHLTSWEVTSFLIGEYDQHELREPIFTVADGVFWLAQEVVRNSVVRRLRVVKARGVAPIPGLHTIRMSRAGVQVFPRAPERPEHQPPRSNERLSSGIAGLDEMLGGGIPRGDSMILAGTTGTGKTTFAMRFAAAGLSAGESVVIAVFEEYPEAYLHRAKEMAADFRKAIDAGTLRIIYLRPLDLSVDETLDELRRSVQQIGATRVIIDSISGFEMALAPAFRDDFRESFYRLIGALTGLGVTIFSTVEVVERGGNAGLQLTGYQVSFLTDDIISQRYVEIEGALRKVVAVVKMRGSAHSTEFRAYDITANGVQLGESLRDYDGILSGMPVRQLRPPRQPPRGLTEEESRVLGLLPQPGSFTPQDVARRADLAAAALEPIFARLLALGYLRAEGTGYRLEGSSGSG